MNNFRIKDLMITVGAAANQQHGYGGLENVCAAPTKREAVLDPHCYGPSKCGSGSQPDCFGPSKCGSGSQPDCFGPSKCGSGSQPDCFGPSKCGSGSQPDEMETGSSEDAGLQLTLNDLKKMLAVMQARKDAVKAA